ncbi:MAG: hypothetical protein Q7S14_03190 [bacterium]|nr:hypothetical protein [bacterium]
MLINTNQLVNLTNLRNDIGNYVDQAKNGQIFYITEKGQLTAALVPLQVISDVKPEEKFFVKIEDLRKRFAKMKFADNRDSTVIIREMRDQQAAKYDYINS